MPLWEARHGPGHNSVTGGGRGPWNNLFGDLSPLGLLSRLVSVTAGLHLPADAQPIPLPIMQTWATHPRLGPSGSGGAAAERTPPTG
eukprot:scaffold377_cov563-Prasinococcus_capsulatus_cf.AAC.36